MSTILITGGHSGLGFEAITRVAQRGGYDLVLAGRSLTDMEAAARDLRARHRTNVKTVELSDRGLPDGPHSGNRLGEKRCAYFYFHRCYRPGNDPHGLRDGCHRNQWLLCMVSRSFSGASDAPERWNPKIRAAECLNPPATRSVAPFARLRTAMVLAGRTTAEIISRIKVALGDGEIPPLEPGAMSYMMSKASYLTDDDGHDMPHLMFFVPVKNAADWGANAPDSPVIGANYWFFTPGHEAERDSLPALSVFIAGVTTWSDGTAAPPHAM